MAGRALHITASSSSNPTGILHKGHRHLIVKFGLTQTFNCSYLSEEKERLLVFAENQNINLKSKYELMLAHGFRRSGEQIYRPSCPTCSACQSIGIPVGDFVPSKNQKRVRNKNNSLQTFISRVHHDDYYELYEIYINTRHSNGNMYPATLEQYQQFLFCTWLSPMFIEFRMDNQLVMVAAVDEMKYAFSTLYTFFDPTYASHSLGTYAILEQIRQAQFMGKEYVYLGYQIDNCRMNYKRDFSAS